MYLSHLQKIVLPCLSCALDFSETLKVVVCPLGHSGLFLKKGFVLTFLLIVGVHEVHGEQPSYVKWGGKAFYFSLGKFDF